MLTRFKDRAVEYVRSAVTGEIPISTQQALIMELAANMRKAGATVEQIRDATGQLAMFMQGLNEENREASPVPTSPEWKSFGKWLVVLVVGVAVIEVARAVR
jgi:hypothetical protein